MRRPLTWGIVIALLAFSFVHPKLIKHPEYLMYAANVLQIASVQDSKTKRMSTRKIRASRHHKP